MSYSFKQKAPFFVAERAVNAASNIGSAKQTSDTSTGGFVPANPMVHALYNRFIGLVLFAMVSVPFAFLLVLVLLTQGRPIFYRGPRLGKDQKPFDILKFRTLDQAKAQQLTADKVLPRDSNIETKLGKFMRASRLDELPQLLNIIRGDMNIVGPRPVRAQIAAIEAARNPFYAVRFRVAPGLIGPTQAYMCHGTSKRIRARYNYGLCMRKVSYTQEIALFVRVGAAVCATTARLIAKRVLPRDPETTARLKAGKWNLSLLLENGVSLPVQAFDDLKIAVNGPKSSLRCKLVIHQSKGLRRANVLLTPLADGGFLTHSVEPMDEAATHLVGRYLMNDPVVLPRARRRGKLPTGNVADVALAPIEP